MTVADVHAVLPDSLANGPGRRYAIWFQGCSLACPGCFNPETHAFAAAPRPVDELVAQAVAAKAEGITATGGEPLEQPEALRRLCEAARAADLGVIVLTGFARAEIEADPVKRAAIAAADLVVAGRYNPRLRLGTGLRGSSNKRHWWLTARYRPADLAAVPEAEVRVDPDGTVTYSGMEAP